MKLQHSAKQLVEIDIHVNTKCPKRDGKRAAIKGTQEEERAAGLL